MTPRLDAESLPDPPRVRLVRTLPIGHEQLWGLVSDPEGLATWFPSPEVSFEPRPGATIIFAGDPYDPEGSTGTVLTFDEGREFSFEWGDDRLDLVVEQTSLGQSRLTLVDTLADVGGAARNAVGWSMCLDSLEAAATGAASQPADLSDFAALVEVFKAQGFPDDGWLPDEPNQADPSS